jgi:hypothetical protein
VIGTPAQGKRPPAGEASDVNAVADQEPCPGPSSARLVTTDGVPAPEAPRDLAATGIEPTVLAELALKAAHLLPRCTTNWVAGQLHLPLPLTEQLLEQLTQQHLTEVLGQEGPFDRRYAVTARGHERAVRLLEVSGYVGPVPVPLDAYAEMVTRQRREFPEVALGDVQKALAELVLPPEDVLTAALAVMSQRSLFIFGPAGNGKTSMARLLHGVARGDLWVPHAVAAGRDVVRVFDPQVHEMAEFTPSQPWKLDARWARVRRPFAVAGGEMTIESLELAASPARGVYEAPLHIKSNGGTFVIDDLGRQRVEPFQLLNRWIVPMEYGYDFFTTRAGAKVRLPFQQMLIVATNLDPVQVTDPAFLRRMGYRLHLAAPSAGQYQDIFRRLAAARRAAVPDGLLDRLVERYEAEGRELRGCEPRDLLGRVSDICRLRERPLEVTEETLDLAWSSYFGTRRGGA